jgi:pimeloyl-ACP methyl ester carboxylesterase
MPSESVVRFRTLDGLNLTGTLARPDQPGDRGIVLVHGGGVTREEGGFFTRLAAGLGEAGVASLRYDLRGHGESEGSQMDSPLTAHLNDIWSALTHLRESTGASRLSLLGASFSGGLAAYYAARGPDELTRLILFNPLLDYKNRFVDQKPYWSDDHLDDREARQLTEYGYLAHSPTFKLGRAMLNEVFWIHPRRVLGEITAPTLIVHGTKDTFVPVESSREALPLFKTEHQLVEIEGSQHGFAVHDDPQYLNPQSQAWQALVIETIAEWITANS